MFFKIAVSVILLLQKLPTLVKNISHLRVQKILHQRVYQFQPTVQKFLRAVGEGVMIEMGSVTTSLFRSQYASYPGMWNLSGL